MHFTVLGKFPSRTNIVNLARTDDGKLVIFKKYKDRLGMLKESEVLKKFSACGYAPMVLEQGDDYLLNEYVDGDLLFDGYRHATMMDDKPALIKLAGELSVFLQIFYSMFEGRIIGDINFKNYILKDNRCYGIDYESVCEGMPYSDVADIVANALINATGDPTSALPFISKILQDFHFDMIDIVNDVRLSLTKIMERNGCLYDINVLLNILMYYNDNPDNGRKEGII